jgi:Fic family protein
MSDLEKFLHNDAIQVPALIRIAIAHYQFETIHPFLDGNGRIGRLLIPLFLVDQGVLHKPLLYLSVFFEQNRSLYYDSLTLVRTHNDMAQWIKYFLKGMAETAENATQTLVAVLDLKRRLERELSQSFGKRAAAALQLLGYLFVKPTINIKQAEAQLGVSFKSANDLVADFVAAGVLKEMTGQSRNRVFVFDAYLALFRG